MMTYPTSDKQLFTLEHWLQVLLVSYQTNPNRQLAQGINDYLNQILSHEDSHYSSNDNGQAKACQYHAMQRYWRWQLSKWEQPPTTINQAAA